jgi:hypothetical protein
VVLTDYFNARREANEANGVTPPGWRFMRGTLGPVPLHPTPAEAAEVSPSSTRSSPAMAERRPGSAPPDR